MPDEYPLPSRCQNPAVCKRIKAAGHAVNAAFKALSWDHWDELEHQMIEGIDNPLFAALVGRPVDRGNCLGSSRVSTLGNMTDEGDWEIGFALAELQFEGALPVTPPFDVVAAAVKKLEGIDLTGFTDWHWFGMHRCPDFWPDEVF